MLTLVTGLDGFTGQYLKQELEAHGHTIVGLQCDITDAKAVDEEIAGIQPEYVIHLAAIAFVGHGDSDANKFYEVNLIGTRNLLAGLYLHAPNIESILLASSANVYGNHRQGKLTEDTILAPTNDYAVSKLAMEQMAQLWVEKLPIFIVRPFNYTGVGQDENFVIPKIVSHFKNKRVSIELGNLDVWREFGDVRAVAEVYRRLLEICPAGETLNICTGETYSLREVILMCEKITGHKIEINVNRKFIRENELRVLSGDNSRLKEIVPDWNSTDIVNALTWLLNDSENRITPN